MRLGFEESVAIVADFLYPGQPQVQQIISPTSVLAGHVLWSRFLPRGSSPGILSEEERLGGSGGATGGGYPISVSGEGASCSEVSVGWGVSLGSGSRILSD
jgi:hypothetical protein